MGLGAHLDQSPTRQFAQLPDAPAGFPGLFVSKARQDIGDHAG